MESLQEILSRCDHSLKDKKFPGKFDVPTRNAIKVAKTQLNETRKAGLTDLDTDTLNDKSYNAIERTCKGPAP